MSEKSNDKLRMVDTNWEEIEEKVRARRRKRLRLILIIVVICAAVGIACFLILQRMTYDNYTVTGEYARSDTSATHYISFGDGYVAYSNDGASYVTADNTDMWNQSFEMENPIVASCQSYMAVADNQGETIYIMNEDGIQGEVSVTMPISRIDVASQGTVAVLMIDSGTGYLSVFDVSGEQIAEGAVHVENTGTPTDIALSADGKNLAVSIVDVSSGMAGTTINLYNFSAAGQNQIDNMVGSFTYADTIVPELTYAGDGTLMAFGDNGVYTFEGSASPEESDQLIVTEEIQSIFYDDSYFGLVYSKSQGDPGRVVYVYDTNCNEQTVIETDFTYDDISFLDNHEVCCFNESHCSIYTLSGLAKYDQDTDGDIRGVFHIKGFRDYLFLKEGTTECIRFTLALDSEEFRALFGSGNDAEDEE
ncbi:MAG: DUF5711 family protein [Clostridiales bacterium]|nr:DUF5711 family protein [Clostridiales bacterium]